MHMTFGKYRGREFSSIPTDYLQWLIGNCDWLGSLLRRHVEAELAKRKEIMDDIRDNYPGDPFD